VRKAYLEARALHGDLGEFNIKVKTDNRILAIDRPQFVGRIVPVRNASITISNVLLSFQWKFRVRKGLKDGLRFVEGGNH